MSTDLPAKEKAIRLPSLVDALIPLLFMIALLATSIVLFGIDAAIGPLQVALLMSAVVAAVVAAAFLLLRVVGRGRFPWVQFYAKGKESGFSLHEIHLRWPP